MSLSSTGLSDPAVDTLADAVADDGLQTPVWAVFGDLMAGLLGAFALILVCVLALQLELSQKLETETRRRAEEARRLASLEQLLAGPLAAGRVTLRDGRIGISGSLLFAFNSAELEPEGQQLIRSLAGPLGTYLRERQQVLMVSGFTDNRQVRGGATRFEDNWELSAQRALTVTRALIDAGLPAADVFAAAFGAQQAVASNQTAEGRAQNRRVEMAPMPRPVRAAQPATAAPVP